jgi:hypothetical protein
MHSIRIAIQAGDPATTAAVRRELEALRGREPSGAELLQDPAPRTQGFDPLVATAIVGLVAGIAGGAGQQIGVAVMTWLLERIRAVVKRQKTSVILTVGDVSERVDEHTRPQDAAAKLLKVS